MVPPRRPGRPSKLDAERQGRLLEGIRAGLTMEVAARRAGISVATLHRWLARGEAEESGRFREFCDQAFEAQADAEASCLARVMEAGREDWRAAAWIMERRWSERWARRQTFVVDSAEAETTRLQHQLQLDFP